MQEFLSQYFPVFFIIVAILATIYALFKFVFFAIRKFNNKKEKQSLREDLTLWKNLANMLGAKDKSKDKERFSQGSILLKEIFKRVIVFFKKNKLLQRKTPTFVVVGEPLSGKTSFLETQSAFIQRAFKDDSDKEKALINFYYSSNAIFLDVNGKIFLDRWLDGASAEWGSILSILFKRQKFNVSGIIVTIPADALLADTKELTEKKASYIAHSIHDFTKAALMGMPVYIVITKLDRVTGFSEFLNFFTNEQEKEILGFIYSGDKYSWDSYLDHCESFMHLLNSLRDKALANNFKEYDASLDMAAPIFLFSKEINHLFDNLNYYIKSIFLESELRTGAHYSLFQGLFFVANQVDNIYVNVNFARQKGKEPDDAIIKGLQHSTPRKSIFTKNIFTKIFFNDPKKPIYTKKRILLNNLPYIVLCCVIGAFSLDLLIGAIINTNNFKNTLSQKIPYLETTRSLFVNDTISNIPLISLKDDYRVDLSYTAPMSDGSGYTRMDFYWNTIFHLREKTTVPWGFKFASLLSGDGFNIRWSDRSFIANQIQTFMVFLPTIYTLQRLLTYDNAEPMTLSKVNALRHLMQASNYDNSVVREHNYLYDNSTLKSYLNFLLPNADEQVIDIMSSFDPSNDKLANTTNVSIRLSPNYKAAIESGLNSIYKGYENITIYPETDYIKNRNTISKGYELYESYEALKVLANDNSSVFQIDNVTIEKYRALSSKILQTIEILNTGLGERLTNLVGTHNDENVNNNVNQNKEAKKNLLENSFIEYNKYFEDDFAYIKIYGTKKKSKNVQEALNLYITNETYNQFSENYNRIKQKLREEYVNVNAQRNKLDKSLLFAYNDVSAVKEDYNYELLQRLLSNATYEIERPKVTLANFVDLIQNEQNRFKEKKDKLEQIIINGSDNQIIVEIGDFIRKILVQQALQVQSDIIDEFLSLYPNTINGIANSIIVNYENSNNLGFKNHSLLGNTGLENLNGVIQRSREILGQFDFFPEYDPRSALIFTKPFAFLLKYFEDIQTDSTYFLLQKKYQQDSLFITVKDNILDYVRLYLNYWGSFTDSISPSAKNYYDFYQYVNRVRAYQINSVLVNLYDISHSAIKQIDDSILDKNLIESKRKLQQHLLAKESIFSTSFNDQSTKLLSAWAGLPDSPLTANSYINGQSKKKLLSSLLILSSDENDVNSIPFYAKLIKLGTNLIKSQAFEETHLRLGLYLQEFMHFPLLHDSHINDISLSSDQMYRLKEMLISLGISNKDLSTNISATIDDIDRVPDKKFLLHEVFTPQEEVISWGKACLDIIDILIEPEKMIRFEIYIPGEVEQQALKESLGIYLPSALGRMRYVTVSSEQENLNDRWSTSTNNKSLYSGKILDSDLKFSFYQYSDDKEAESVSLIAGDLSLLRVYFDKNSIYEAKDKKLYYPLYLKDSKGAEYCLFICFSLSDNLPSLESWPNTYNWPRVK